MVLRLMTLSLVATVLLAVSGPAEMAAQVGPSRLKPGDHTLSVTLDKRDRTYLLRVPPQTTAGQPLPVVLNFHGGGTNAKSHKEWIGLDAVADREGFLTVYPDGTGRFGQRLLTWNAGTCCAYARDHGVDDVRFVLALLADLAGRTPVDHTRVYAAGMSNGAMLSYRLAAEVTERIAAIAPVAGGMVVESFAPSLPMPVMHFHSVDDPMAPYAGGPGKTLIGREMHPRVEDTIERWVRHNGCAPQPTVGATLYGSTHGSTRGFKRGADSAQTATKMVYDSCREGSEVVLWKLTGAGHVWPGPAPKYPEKLLGAPTSVINASEEMWRFFRRFSRPGAPRLAQ